MDYAKRYLYKDDVLVTLAKIENIIDETAQAHCIESADSIMIAKAQSLAACFVAWEKDDNASIAISLKYPETGKHYTAIAEKDGRVRGCVSDFKGGVIKTGVILEITQRLPIKGDYTGVVADDTEEKAVESYFKNSRQTIGICRIHEDIKKCIYCRGDGEIDQNVNECIYCLGDDEIDENVKEIVYCRGDDEIHQNVKKCVYCLVVEYIPGHFLQQQSTALSKAAVLEAENFLQPFIDSWDEKFLTDTADFKLTESNELKYGCTCTRRSVSKMLAALSSNEREELSDNADKELTVICKFCGKNYNIKM